MDLEIIRPATREGGMYTSVLGCKHDVAFTCILKFHGDTPIKLLHLFMFAHIVTFFNIKI